MTGSQRISGEAFAIERLRDNPDLDYASLRRKAEEAGVNMQPIQYGRARKALGLPPLSTRGEPRNVNPAPAPLPASAIDEPSDEAGEPAIDEADEVTPPAAVAPPRRKGSAAFDFLVQALRAEPNLVYAVLRERAEAKGFKIAPIMYGRAKAVLGLVPVKPRGQGARKAATAPVEAPRVLKQVESVAADRFHRELENVRNLEQLVNTVKELDADRRRLRDLLERIVAMIDQALG